MENTTIELNLIQAITKKEFVTLWKAASNDKRRKPIYKEEEIKVYSYETKRYEPIKHKVKVKGFLYPEHHIIYNIVRGFPASRGFGENTDGYLSALGFFKSKYLHQSFMDVLYEPFRDSMTKEKFDNLIIEVKNVINN